MMNFTDAHSARRKMAPFAKRLIIALCAFMNAQLASAQVIEPENTNYVKLNFNIGNSCGGSLVSNDLVLTASHCILDSWSYVIVYFGRKFSNNTIVRRDDSTPNFIKLDHHGVPADLALIKLEASVAGKPGAEILPFVAQEDCEFKDIVMQAYLRMSGPEQHLPKSEMEIKNVLIDRIGLSAIANGLALISNTPVGVGGDSGSPLMRPDGVQAGVWNGSGGGNSYFAALCKYSDDIKRFAAELHGAPPK